MAFIDDVELDERVNQRLARLAQYEPAGYVDGPDLYEFVMDDPVDHVDPLGLAAAATQPSNPVIPKPPVSLLGPDMTINPQFIQDFVDSQGWGHSDIDDQGKPFTNFKNLVDPFASPEQQARINKFNQSALAHEAKARDLLKKNVCPTMTTQQKEAAKNKLFNKRTSQFERDALEDLLPQLLTIVENTGYDGSEDAALAIQQVIDQLKQLDRTQDTGK